jgi:hypothetical protein
MASSQQRGFTLTIFLPDGVPDGLRIVEKSNWTGRGVVCPRPVFPQAKSRNDFDRAGVYVLAGPSSETGLPEIYIGEGDPIRPRLESHFSKKDFWTTAIFFTSKDENLNKAHVQYLEARLIQLAAEAKRCELKNGNAPQPPSLSEADVAEVEGFLDEVLLCFPVIGLSVFEKPSQPQHKVTQLKISSKSVLALGYESIQGFVVTKGSEAVIDEMASIRGFVSQLRKAMLANGILQNRGQKLIFSQDYEFNSPSTAAEFVLGRSANGRTAWLTASGHTLKELQEAAQSRPVK